MLQKYPFVHIILITVIIVIAIILRTVNIDTAPPGLYPDEANNAINAYDAQASGDYQWFYPDNNGREGLYINAMALGFKLFGVSPLTIKLPSIIFGVLTVLGVFLLTRELFPSRARMPFLASYLTAVSFWAINFSRIGFRAIMMLPIVTFTFYFIFRGIRTHKFANYIYAGLIFGLGFHSYIAFRIAPAILVILFVLFLLIDSGFLKSYWKGILAFTIAAFLTAAPLFWTLHLHPEYLTARTGDVSIFAPAHNEGPLVVTLAKTVGLSLQKYNIYGDPNFRHNYAPWPLLEPLTGLFFLAGVGIAIVGFMKYLRLRFTHNIRNRNLVVYGLLLAWFVAFLAPEFLTTEGLPHALRSIGTLPVVYILAALGINALINWILLHRAQTKIFLLVLVGIVLFYIGLFNATKYHLFWAHNPKTAIAFHKELTDIAQTLPTYPAYKEKIIVAGWLERLSIALFTHSVSHVTYVHPDAYDSLTLSPQQIIFLPTYNTAVINHLITTTAGEKILIETHERSLNTVFYTIRFPVDR